MSCSCQTGFVGDTPFGPEELFYIVPSDFARNRSDGVETDSPLAAGEAEAASTLGFHIFDDAGFRAVARLLDQIEYIDTIAELHINGRGAPLHPEGLVSRVNRPGGRVG